MLDPLRKIPTNSPLGSHRLAPVIEVMQNLAADVAIGKLDLGQLQAPRHRHFNQKQLASP